MGFRVWGFRVCGQEWRGGFGLVGFRVLSLSLSLSLSPRLSLLSQFRSEINPKSQSLAPYAHRLKPYANPQPNPTLQTLDPFQQPLPVPRTSLWQRIKTRKPLAKKQRVSLTTPLTENPAGPRSVCRRGRASRHLRQDLKLWFLVIYSYMCTHVDVYGFEKGLRELYRNLGNYKYSSFGLLLIILWYCTVRSQTLF